MNMLLRTASQLLIAQRHHQFTTHHPLLITKTWEKPEDNKKDGVYSLRPKIIVVLVFRGFKRI
jgi:hypothetical protein